MARPERHRDMCQRESPGAATCPPGRARGPRGSARPLVPRVLVQWCLEPTRGGPGLRDPAGAQPAPAADRSPHNHRPLGRGVRKHSDLTPRNHAIGGPGRSGKSGDVAHDTGHDLVTNTTRAHSCRRSVRPPSTVTALSGGPCSGIGEKALDGGVQGSRNPNRRVGSWHVAPMLQRADQPTTDQRPISQLALS